MNKSIWVVAGIMAGVALLAAASYVAISLVFSGAVGLGENGTVQGHGYAVIQPTEVPTRLPDIVGPVVEVQDKSFVVQSHSKGLVDSNGPRTEIVIAAGTQVFQDITDYDTATVVGGKLQRQVAPYRYYQIKVGDLLMVWGDLRGDRLIAEAIIVEVNTPTSTP